jgi:hypothetical protein
VICRFQRGLRRQIMVVVAMCSLCAVVPARVLAGQGPTYDPAIEATHTGTVEEVQGGGPGRLGWLMRVHTLGLGHKSANEKQLFLKTDTDTLRIHLGPTAFLNDRRVEIEEGDRLVVTGSRVAIGDSQVVLAREIRKGDIAWSLRNAAGQSLWSTTEPDTRRFWTTTKVVLIVVSAKVALLATVLRH